MKLPEKTVYSYRVFTTSHAFKIFSPCSSIESLWEEIEKSSIIDFQYPDTNGNIIDLSIRSKTIEAIDVPWGTEPVSRYDGPTPTEAVTNRAVLKGGKVILGQQAKKVEKKK